MLILKENNYHIFSLKNEKLPSSDPKKKYTYSYSHAKTYLLFQKIASNVPLESGSIILFGEKKGKMTLKGSIQKNSSLRSEFRHGLKIQNDGSSSDWFTYMTSLLQTQQYQKIRVYITASL